ncbi:MAG: type II toxin-antitoxin system RelE/ParE family toxin [Phycisphaerae bacterium]|nr:type II toxin-antitoxin system RelE/ParE family toxin [Phycisphaerae bacterium]
MIFVETRMFTSRLKGFLTDKAYSELQKELAEAPRHGDVMKGCGGLRKLRMKDVSRGKGRRGGARVIYLYVPEANRIDFIAIYGKNEQDDLTMKQKKELKALAAKAKAEAIQCSRKERQ